VKEQELKIDGMHCQHCVMAVRKELSGVPGVQVKDVKIGSALVMFDEHQVTPARLAEAIHEAGYSVVS
jgi:copper chaperone